ncbi:MAG: hypothetical protein ACRCUS_04770, partial [Anaerovoracaceae bacterium]
MKQLKSYNLRLLTAIILTLALAVPAVGFFAQPSKVKAADPTNIGGAVLKNNKGSDNFISMSEKQDLTFTFTLDNATSQVDAEAIVDAGKFNLYRNKADLLFTEESRAYQVLARGAGRGRTAPAGGSTDSDTKWTLADWKCINEDGTAATGGNARAVFDTTSSGLGRTVTFNGATDKATVEYKFKADYLFPTQHVYTYCYGLTDVLGNYKLEFEKADNTILAQTTVKYYPYESYRTVNDIYSELDASAAAINAAGMHAEVRTMGKTFMGNDMKYLIVAKNSTTVTDWEALCDSAEADPTKILSQLKDGKINGKKYQVPIVYSNIHPYEYPG